MSYFTFDAWKLEEARTWLRDGDAVISVAPKSGTTWLLYCTHQIRVKGEDWDFKDVSYSTPWVEFIQKPVTIILFVNTFGLWDFKKNVFHEISIASMNL